MLCLSLIPALTPPPHALLPALSRLLPHTQPQRMPLQCEHTLRHRPRPEKVSEAPTHHSSNLLPFSSCYGRHYTHISLQHGLCVPGAFSTRLEKANFTSHAVEVDPQCSQGATPVTPPPQCLCRLLFMFWLV